MKMVLPRHSALSALSTTVNARPYRATKVALMDNRWRPWRGKASVTGSQLSAINGEV